MEAFLKSFQAMRFFELFFLTKLLRQNVKQKNPDCRFFQSGELAFHISANGPPLQEKKRKCEFDEIPRRIDGKSSELTENV